MLSTESTIEVHLLVDEHATRSGRQPAAEAVDPRPFEALERQCRVAPTKSVARHPDAGRFLARGDGPRPVRRDCHDARAWPARASPSRSARRYSTGVDAWWPPESPGTWADWVAGMATAVAVAVALYNANRSRRDLLRAQQEDRQRRIPNSPLGGNGGIVACLGLRAQPRNATRTSPSPCGAVRSPLLSSPCAAGVSTTRQARDLRCGSTGGSA